MKLEYLASGSTDCPLIRLYDFTPAEAQQLVEEIEPLSKNESDRLVLEQLPWIEPIAGCSLTLCVRKWDQGVVRIGKAFQFECGFTADTWDNVIALIEPFTKRAAGYQWLAGIPGEAGVLLSPSGQW
jgi:hypothetical protein